MPSERITRMRSLIASVTAASILWSCAENDPQSAAQPKPITVIPLSPVATPLPKDRVVFDSDRSGNYEIYVMSHEGSNVVQLTSDVKFDTWWPRVSPDRRQILFHRSPKGVNDRDYTKVSLWVMNADGSAVRELRPVGADGWALQGHAAWSPDGRQLVMFGGKRISPQIFVTDVQGRNPRAITSRGGQNLDPSWSPDGRTIVFTACPSSICFERDYEIYTIDADGVGEPVRITNDKLRDHDPYYSPDGKGLAWLTQTSTKGPVGTWNIRIANADGTNLRAVTNDDQINSKPAWSFDGALIYFHRLDAARSKKFSIYSIRPDGMDMRALKSDPRYNHEYPSQ